jgi:hypothetical protein
MLLSVARAGINRPGAAGPDFGGFLRNGALRNGETSPNTSACRVKIAFNVNRLFTNWRQLRFGLHLRTTG